MVYVSSYSTESATEKKCNTISTYKQTRFHISEPEPDAGLLLLRVTGVQRARHLVADKNPELVDTQNVFGLQAFLP